MKSLTQKTMLLLAIMALALNACVQIEIRDDNKSTSKVTSVKTNEIQIDETQADSTALYGDKTQDIEQLLAATPVGSEVYLEDRGDGQWYLRIEKIFVEGKEYLGQSNVADDPIEMQPSPQEQQLDGTLYADALSI
jgi:hypothetical protein